MCPAVSPSMLRAARMRGSAVLQPGRLGRIAGAGAGIRLQRQQQHGEGVARRRHRILLHGRDEVLIKRLAAQIERSDALLLSRCRMLSVSGLLPVMPMESAPINVPTKARGYAMHDWITSHTGQKCTSHGERRKRAHPVQAGRPGVVAADAHVAVVQVQVRVAVRLQLIVVLRRHQRRHGVPDIRKAGSVKRSSLARRRAFLTATQQISPITLFR